MAAASGQSERRLEAVGRHVHLGARVEEQSGHLDVPVHGGLHERGVHLVRLVLLVGAGLEQEAHHLEVALVAGERERRLLELVRVRVDAGPVLQEDLGDGHVAGRGGLHEGRVPVLVVVLHVGASLEQQPHDLLVPAGARVHERRVAGRGLRVHVRPVLEQQAHDVRVAGGGRLHERRAVALHAAVLNVGAHGEQHLGQLVVAGRAGQRQ